MPGQPVRSAQRYVYNPFNKFIGFGHFYPMRSHKSEDRFGIVHNSTRDLQGRLSPSSRISAQRLQPQHHSNVHSLPEKESANIRNYCLRILKRRNLAFFLLKCCQVSGQNDIASIDTAVSLSFLLLKASTQVITQLSKFLATGHDIHIKIPEKQFYFFSKTGDFFTLQAQISKQMNFSKKQLNFMVGKIEASFANLLEDKEFLTETMEEQINEEYLHTKIIGFIKENLQNERIHALEKGSLNYLLLMTYIRDFGSYEHLFEELINEETTDLQSQTLMVKVQHMSGSEIIDKLHSFCS